MNQAASSAKIKRASISANTSGDNELIALVANKRLRIISLFMSVSTAGTARFESSTGNNFVSGAVHLAVGTPLVLPHNPVGWFETLAGESLNMILSGTLGAAGALTYQEIG